MMKIVSILMMAMCMILPLSACESSGNPNEVEVPNPVPNPDDSGNNSSENANQTAVTLTVGDVVLRGYLNDNKTAKDLIARLPITVHLNRGVHDYCGGISPALAYDESDVQYGWKNGDLAFWTAGNDFVIFHSEEENSSSIGDIVNIGHLTTDLETVRNLEQNITVTIALDNNNSTNNETTTQMNITVNGHTLTAILDNNVTAQAFAAKLPITLPMMDLYGREMCYRFPEALPTDDAKTRGYEVGEIVYYPPMHSFVIMYKQNGEHFQMQSIGRVQGDVSIFDGIGDVNVTFTKANTTSVNSAKAHATSVEVIGNIVNVKGNGTLNVTVFDSKGGTLQKKHGKDSVAVDCNGFHGLALVQVKGEKEALTLKKVLIK